MKDYSSIVVESKVCLLRNINGFNFPCRFGEQEGLKVLNKIADIILKINDDFKIYKMSNLPELDIGIMHEKGLVTNHLIENAQHSSAVILSKEEDVEIMINEQEHLCEKCTMKGLSLISAYDRLESLDNQILSKLDIAYDDSLGFLTSKLSNVGTGLKAGITLFLPALSLAGKIKEITTSLFNQGFDFIPVSNDQMEGGAYTFTIANSQTIGKRETDYVVKVTEFAIKICEMEIRARNEFLTVTYLDDVKDKIYRAWGVLTNCYKIGVFEARQLLGELKMGVALDLVRFKEVGFIENLMVDILPYSLTKISESKVTISDLDKYRAKFLSGVLKTKRIK